MTNDVEMVHAAQAGNGAAFGLLLEAHRARLYATALAILGDRARAQDAVQDAFLVALQRIQDLREPAAVGAWLHTIVRNACRMRLRASRELSGVMVAEPESQQCEAEEALDRMALRDWLWTALEALPEDERTTVMLRNFTRHTAYAEIAAILGIPVGTVRSRLNHAKRRLADALLASAAAVHRDHAALVEERWCWLRAVVDQVEREGAATLYVAGSLPDTLVEAPALGYRAFGVGDYAQDMIETIAAGVRMHFTAIVASDTVTIVEGEYQNPVEDPHHCPAFHTEVRLHPHGQTTRIILYYGHDDYGSPREEAP